MNTDMPIEDQIAKFLSGEASPEEAMQIELWRIKSVANQKIFDASSQLFNLSDKEFNGREKEMMWSQIKKEMPVKLKVVSKRNKIWPLSIAASFLVLMAAGWFLILQHNKQNATFFYESVETSKQVQLNDGTEITLFPNSALTTSKDYGQNNRNIILQGSASFSVPHNSNSPFIVNINKLHVKDLGTKFTITQEANGKNIQVLVQEGSVIAYLDNGKSVTLLAGESANYNEATGQILASPKQSIDTLESDQVTKTNTSPDKTNTISPSSDTFLVTNADTLIALSIKDVEKILGQPVALVNNDKNKNDGLVKYHRQYRAKADGTINLYSDIEYYLNEAAAKKAYSNFLLKMPEAQELSKLKTAQADAVKISEEKTFYQLLVRKRNILLLIKISRLKEGFSEEELIKATTQLCNRIK